MALEARMGRKGLCLVSRGRPTSSQGDRGVQELRMGMLGSDNMVAAMEYGAMSVG